MILSSFFCRLCIGIVCLAISLGYQQVSSAQADIDDLYRQLSLLNDKGETLAGVLLLQRALTGEKSLENRVQIEQALAQQMTFAGQYSAAIDIDESWITLPPGSQSQDKELPADLLAGLSPVPALEAIVAEADHHRIVVINEGHDEGATRAFNRRVVRALAAKGFQYLAMETLSKSIERANIDHKVTRQVGYYSNDPVYASIMRSAWAAGYRLIRYEDDREENFVTPCDADAKADWVRQKAPEFSQPFMTEMTSREKNQACNLAQFIAKMPDAAKILVVVGYAHVRKTQGWEGIGESQGDGAMRWMTGFLSAYTGENILAIDQTEQDIHKKQTDIDPLVKQIYRTFVPQVETVFRKPDGTYLLPKVLDGSVDMAVFRPDPREKDNWWRPDDELVEVMLRARSKEFGWPIGLVMALPPGAGTGEVVPLDTYYVSTSGTQEVRLLLPKGMAEIWLDRGSGSVNKIGVIEVTGDQGPVHLVIHDIDHGP